MKANSEEQNCNNSGELVPNRSTAQRLKTEPDTNDGPSIEVVRRSRGRPPGSRNNPKRKVFQPSESMPINLMRPYILEISPDNDVFDALNRFCRRRNIGISILNTTGTFSSLTLRQPSPDSISVNATDSAVTFTGNFEKLSITGGIFPPNFSSHLAVSVPGPQGQIIGGLVAGPIIAAKTVTVVAVGYSDPGYVRIPADEYNSAPAIV